MGKKIPAISILMMIFMMSGNVLASENQERKQLYQDNCARCHGENGKPNLPRAANFQRKEGLRTTDQSLLLRIKTGGRACPAFSGILRDNEILSVITYIRTLH